MLDIFSKFTTHYQKTLSQARALEKIQADGRPLSRVSEATAHLYLASPFGNKPSFLGRLFMTHPPISERVAALRKIT